MALTPAVAARYMIQMLLMLSWLETALLSILGCAHAASEMDRVRRPGPLVRIYAGGPER
jgi:hypothetical protein